MKQCPRCNRTYSSDALSYCLQDGAFLSSVYDREATEVNTFRPPPIVPPTVAYTGDTERYHAPAPGFSVASAAQPRRSPLALWAMVAGALVVGLAIGAIIFQRMGSASSESAAVERTPLPMSAPAATETPIPVRPTPTMTPVPTPIRTPAQSVVESGQQVGRDCFLYNDKSDKSVVRVRQNCDTQDCDRDESTIAGQYPDNTPVRFLEGSSIQGERFTWVKVVVTGTGRTVWVASSKIRCE